MKLIRKRSAKAVGIALAAVALAMGTATSASAGTIAHAYTTDDNPGGHAWLMDEGEQFRVQDKDSDGYRASGYLRFNGNTYRLDDANGAATGDSGGWVSKDFSIAEGTRYEVMVCLRDGADGVAKFCSAWHAGLA
ncbi:hypothetical protein [Streptomyces sp. NPDC013457]|uniref:hypothetical protein n=1 Tax=Streptomyces sp. NPDC013457 TaxID=3364866 RepID=UPI0036F4D972